MRIKSTALATLLFFSSFALALIGGENSPELIPPQLCQIVPIVNGQPVPQMTCSALVIGNNSLRTAGHCGHDFYQNKVKDIYVDCFGGDQFVYSTSEESWVFADSSGPLNPRVKISQSEAHRVPYDVAILKTPEDFKTPPMEVYSDGWEAILKSDEPCFLTATGTDELMRWGHPQAKTVQKESIQLRPDGTLFISGKPHASGHDSGGALVCGNQLVATIVAQAGENSILTTSSPADEQKKEIGNLPLCPGESASEAVINSIGHVLGFSEIRHHLQKQYKRGLRACIGGLTLNKNAYQYYKNLMFIKFTDRSGEVKKVTTLLFQVSSIQGHHSTEGRPWVVIDSQKVMEQISKILNWDFHWDLVSLGTEPDVKSVLDSVTGKKIEASSVYLQSKNGFDYYLVSWLKEITSANAGVYTSQVSPKYAVVQVDQKNAQTEIISHSSAFNSLLIPSEELAMEASQKASRMSESEKIDFIEQLSAID